MLQAVHVVLGRAKAESIVWKFHDGTDYGRGYEEEVRRHGLWTFLYLHSQVEDFECGQPVSLCTSTCTLTHCTAYNTSVPVAF